MNNEKQSEFAGLDASHKQTIVIGGVGVTLLALLALELKHWQLLQQLTAQGFMRWDTAGLYVHAVPRQTLSFTVAPAQGPAVFTAILAGLAALYLFLAAARVDMHLSTKEPLANLALGLLLVGFSAGYYLLTAHLPRPVLTVDLPNGIITVEPDHSEIGIAQITQFTSYVARAGKYSQLRIGAYTSAGQSVGFMGMPSNQEWEAQSVISALTSFISSGGTAIAPP